MVGIVLISHGGMADGMMTSAPMLFPDFQQVVSLTLWPSDNPDDFQEKLAGKIQEVDTGDGVFILTDLLGGTPCNRAVYFIGEKIRLIAGMNLPMLMTLLFQREENTDLETLAQSVLEETRMGTVDVNKLLEQRKG